MAVGRAVVFTAGDASGATASGAFAVAFEFAVEAIDVFGGQFVEPDAAEARDHMDLGAGAVVVECGRPDP